MKETQKAGIRKNLRFQPEITEKIKITQRANLKQG